MIKYLLNENSKHHKVKIIGNVLCMSHYNNCHLLCIVSILLMGSSFPSIILSNRTDQYNHVLKTLNTKLTQCIHKYKEIQHIPQARNMSFESKS